MQLWWSRLAQSSRRWGPPGSRNKSKIAREDAAAKMVALVGEVIPDALPVTRTPSLCQGPLHVTESALETVTRNEAFPGRRLVGQRYCNGPRLFVGLRPWATFRRAAALAASCPRGAPPGVRSSKKFNDCRRGRERFGR